jgi:hypothetical protein
LSFGVTSNGFAWDPYVGWLLTIGVFGFLFVVMQRAIRWKAKRETELLA